MTPEIEQAKAAILKARRQRIRKTTYTYVAETIIEDTKIDHPYRDRLVIDWWARVVDPLDAEDFDVERLKYFRERLREHRSAQRVNAAIRQGMQQGRQLRRLKPEKLSYVTLQVKRLADRKLNYAAAKKAVETSDAAYKQLTIGLFALPRIAPRKADGVLFYASGVATRDHRFPALCKKLRTHRADYLPKSSSASFERRLSTLTNPHHEDWYVPTDDWADFLHDGLIRKLEEKYSI